MGTLGVSPSSVSPILKSWVTVTLDSSFTLTMNRDEFFAELICTDTDCDYEPTYLYVYEANDVDRTLTIKFPGAPSGNYLIKLIHVNEGRIDSSALEITTESVVTSISHNSGSNLGGTLVTIEGTNFSDDPYDNPV